jgi:CzcA family heavy metal efflux pump
MLSALIHFSLRQRLLVIAVAFLVLLTGAQIARQMPVDVLPELSKPAVTVITECPSLAPEDVAARVTRPLETSLLGLPGLDRLRSSSDAGLSVIFVEFEWGTDLRHARLLVQERLSNTAPQLPLGLTPGLAPASSLLGEIMLIGLSSSDGKTAPPELRSLADTTVRRSLQSIPGVADVLPMGGGVQQVHVLPDPRKLVAHELSFEEVKQAVARATGDASGGWMTLKSQEMAVRVLGLTIDLADLRRTPVKKEGDHVILLGDIARVELGIQPQRGDASVNGRPGVIMSVDKSPGADTLRLTREIERALDQLRPALPAGVEFTILFRQADFVGHSVRNLQHVVRDGVLIIAAVIIIFLGNIRMTLITLAAIPLSFAISFLVFWWLGVGMNTMTLGGLAVALGMVVDDAIVDVENVFRRWRENRQSHEPRPLLQIVAEASGEVRHSIFYATILVLLTFIPLAVLPGLEGQLFRPVAIATCVSIVASFLVSLTVIPVLCSFALQWVKPGASSAPEPLLVRALKQFAQRFVLPLALHRPFFVLGFTAVALSGVVALYPTLRKNFLPAFHENSATVSLVSAPGTSLFASSELGDTAVALLRRIPEVRSVGRRSGRAERDDHIVPVSITEFDLEFHAHGRPRAEVLEDVRRTLGGIPGTLVTIGAPIAHRLAHMLSGTTAKLAIKVFGVDATLAQEVGEKIVEVARGTPGLVDVMLEAQGSVAQIAVVVDRERALAYGLPVTALNEQVTDLISGHVVARVPHGERTMEFLVRLPGQWTDTPEELGSLPILVPSGQVVPLRGVADVRETVGPSVFNRENAQPRLLVTANAAERDWPSLVADLESRLREKVQLPPGAFLRLEGEYEAQRAATQRILQLSGALLLVLGAFLYSYFRSAVLALQVLLNVPLALLGGVFLIWLLGDEVSIATLVGFIAVGGVAARNGVLLLSHYLHLMRHEGEGFTPQMIIRGTLDRIPPVLMTALSAALALLPLVFAAGQPGKELLHPVAVVMVGGLVSSTLLDLCLTPAVFYHFGRKAAARALASKAAAISPGDEPSGFKGVLP